MEARDLGAKHAKRRSPPQSLGFSRDKKAASTRARGRVAAAPLRLMRASGGRAEAEDVGDGPGGGVGVVFAEGGFVAAVHFHFEGADVEIELGFGAAFEMLGGDDADTGGEEFVVEIVHGKG